MTSSHDPSWVLLQVTSPGPGPPSPPLSGSSCPSTKLRSAAGEGRAADPRPRQPPEPTGGGSFPGHMHTPCGAVWPSPWSSSDLCIRGSVSLSRHLPLHGSDTWFGGLGCGSPLYHLPLSLPPIISSLSPLPPFPPECPSMPDPSLPLSPLLWGGAGGGKLLPPPPPELSPVCPLQ